MKNESSRILATIVVRSYNRLDSCIELLEVLVQQDYHPYEIVVVEQSTQSTEEQRALLNGIAAKHDNITILSYGPLGPARARNEGWKAAKGDVVVFCDDDDLPIGTSWLAQHIANYDDPDIIGVSGREVLSIDEVCGYSNKKRAKKMCLSYDFFGYPNVYCRLDERIDRVDWLHGGNASVRRSFIVDVDGWYENMFDHEEHSFAFRLQRRITGNQRLIFDPKPCVLRRKDIPGGLERRKQTPQLVFHRWFRYQHIILSQFRRWRFVLLYPVFLLWLLGETVHSIWKKSGGRAKNSIFGASKLSLYIVLVSPFLYIKSWFLLLEKKK